MLIICSSPFEVCTLNALKISESIRLGVSLFLLIDLGAIPYLNAHIPIHINPDLHSLDMFQKIVPNGAFSPLHTQGSHQLARLSF